MRTLIAFCPILWLLLSLSSGRCRAWKAALVALFIAVLGAFFAFPGCSPISITLSIASGVKLGVYPVCLVILAALFTHAIVVESGAMTVVRAGLTQISEDNRVLALFVVLGFGNFMEGIAGFGTSVAIPVSILIGIGFNPKKAVLVCLVANTVPSAFGSVGVPLFTLAQLTGFDVQTIAHYTVLMQSAIAAATPILILLVLDGRRALCGLGRLLCLVELAFLVPWILVTFFLGYELPNIVASLSVMAVILSQCPQTKQMDFKRQGKAWLPFGLVVLFLITAAFLPAPLKRYASSAVLIFLGAFLGGLLQGLAPRHLIQVLLGTFRRFCPSFATILLVLAMARVMDNVGMVSALAEAIVRLTGSSYPFFAPLVGALGGFITGSVTSSNALFGTMQANIALDMVVSPYTFFGANVMGAGIGKMICPQSIAIAAATAGLIGKEHDIMKQALRWFPGVLLTACILSGASALL